MKPLLLLVIGVLVLAFTPGVFAQVNEFQNAESGAIFTAYATEADSGNAFNGVKGVGSYWQSGDATQTPGWLCVELDFATSINGTGIYPYPNNEYEPTDYTIIASNGTTNPTTGTWSILKTVVGNAQGDGINDSFVNTAAYLKWCLNWTKWNNGVNSGGGIAITEFEGYNNTLGVGGESPAPVTPELIVTGLNVYDGTAIQNFTINLSNSTHSFRNSTSNGVVRFGMVVNVTTYTARLSSNYSGGFFNTSANVTINLTTGLNVSSWQAEILVNATEVLTGDNLSVFNVSIPRQFNVSNASGVARLLVNASVFTVLAAAPRYSNSSVNASPANFEVVHLNLTFGTRLNFSALDRRNSSLVAFSVNISVVNQTFNQSVTNGSAVFVLPPRVLNVTVAGDNVGYARYWLNVSGAGDVITRLPNFTLITPGAVLETAAMSFVLSVPSSDSAQFSGFLLGLNGTLYNTTVANNGADFQYSNVIIAPSIDALSLGMVFNWTYDYLSQRQTESNTVTITELLFSHCSSPSGNGNITLNFSVFNEELIGQDLPVNLEAEFLIYSAVRKGGLQVNFDVKGNSSYAFCLTPRNVTVQADATFKYTPVNVTFTHFYYLNNATLTNVTGYVTAYNFNGTTGKSDLRATVRKRSDFSEFVNTYVRLQRRYVGEGVWRTVQMAKTGDTGLAFFNIIEESVNYRFIFLNENNTILRQTDSMTFSCDSGVCDVTFLVSPTGTSSDSPKFVITSGYNNVTGVVTVDFNDVTGVADTVTVIVSKETYSTYTQVCRQVFTDVSGTATCNTTGYTAPFYVTVLREASPEQFAYREVVGVTARALRNLAGGQTHIALYSALVVIVAGTAGATVGVAASAAFIVFGVFLIALLGVFTFLTSALLIALGIVTAVIAYKVREKIQ